MPRRPDHPELPFALPRSRKPDQIAPVPEPKPEPPRRPSIWARISARIRAAGRRTSTWLWWCLGRWKELTGAAMAIMLVFDLVMLTMGKRSLEVGNYRIVRKSEPTSAPAERPDVGLRPWTIIETGSTK